MSIREFAKPFERFFSGLFNWCLVQSPKNVDNELARRRQLAEVWLHTMKNGIITWYCALQR
jgi:hypothetical protein